MTRPTPLSYLDAVAAIAALEPRGWRLGLDRMQELCRRASLTDALGALGGPQFIHVAGTNGKGSTTAYLQSVLTEAGLHTGAFFSPYVVDYRERIQLGREMISEADLADTASRLFPVAESLSATELGGVTKFEFETGLGLLFWKEHRCEWVALEVGLGGRLDATNVVTPRSAIVVSVGLDHVGVLGDTVEKIAAEKAGIVKAGVPVVVGCLPPEALKVVERHAELVGAPMWRYGKEIQVERSGDSFSVQSPGRRYPGLVSSLEGLMQPHNAALAIAALEAAGLQLEEDAIRNGIAAAYAPGRFQHARYEGCDLLLDGAHNRDAGAVLRASLAQAFPGRTIHLLTNMLSGHDPIDFYAELADQVASVDVVPIDFVRALPVAEAARILGKLIPVVRSHETVEEGLESACEAAGPHGLVLVTGSNYVVGAVARRMRAAATDAQPSPGI